MNRPPTVSVVMPVYNGARYLRQAIASIRWQTFTDWELVCVDDGSTDSSLSILQQFASVDSRIRVLEQENMGIVEALNNGIQSSTGTWLARMDADDIALPTRFQRQLQFIHDNPEIVVVGSFMQCIDPEGMPICDQVYFTRHDEIEKALLSGESRTLGHPSVLIQRRAAIDAGLYRSQYEWIEDIDLWLRIASIGKLANVPQILLQYRLHEQSVCWKRRGLQRTLMPKLIAEAHRVRGLPVPDANAKVEKSPRKQTSAAGKWARQAARSGQYRSAWKHWRRQAAAEPFSLLTCRVTLETLFRTCESFFKKSSTRLETLPDWRRWDAPRGKTHHEADRAA